ncbi:hypothetical protein RchiOBHm_Chr3g0466521 [Rosa chinensis]|uniref:Uncharacterized protein n=1 Tax=Rosa chinensis TaxID=74649 RepID=A0A2P6RA10_ROSCH|nr:hypothetical protein RchiOBHm_Chr3g0466521 [Rosa chinensis]
MFFFFCTSHLVSSPTGYSRDLPSCRLGLSTSNPSGRLRHSVDRVVILDFFIFLSSI